MKHINTPDKGRICHKKKESSFTTTPHLLLCPYLCWEEHRSVYTGYPGRCICHRSELTTHCDVPLQPPSSWHNTHTHGWCNNFSSIYKYLICHIYNLITHYNIVEYYVQYITLIKHVLNQTWFKRSKSLPSKPEWPLNLYESVEGLYHIHLSAVRHPTTELFQQLFHKLAWSFCTDVHCTPEHQIQWLWWSYHFFPHLANTYMRFHLYVFESDVLTAVQCLIIYILYNYNNSVFHELRVSLSPVGTLTFSESLSFQLHFKFSTSQQMIALIC